ncbi:MAG: hypothetical protein JNM93_01565 [Bacteriovoracaceae bacterium]|nr:hypothetical protein [Bacteriovoracaceae bacterium]
MFLFITLLMNAWADTPTCLEKTAKQSPTVTIQKAAISNQELLTRLVMAEGISTNYQASNECSDRGAEIFEAIAWGVVARLKMGETHPTWAKKFGKTIPEVVLKPGQFAPAISEKSAYSKYFLCPTQAPEWEKHWGWASVAAGQTLLNPHKSPFIDSKYERAKVLSLVSHFYYPLSKQAHKIPPLWANPKAQAKNLVGEIEINNKRIPHTCILFFRHEKPL